MNLSTRPDQIDDEGQVALREALNGSSGRENLLNELAWVRRRLGVEARTGLPPQYTMAQLAQLFDRAETYIADRRLQAVLIGEGCQEKTCYCHDEDVAVPKTSFCSHCGCRWVENI